MQQRASAVYAAIDIGSNTIEGLIARCSANNVQTITHQTAMVRLGESVDNKGEIARDKFKMALETVRKYQKLAKNQGAEVILAFATEALREARNSQDFIEAVKRETGVEVQLISGYAEAVLDFYGATYNTTTTSNVGVLDVGGGSTELVTANKRNITWLTSIPIGSGALHDRYLPSDPPTHEEMEGVRSYLASQLQMIHIPESPSTLIVTGSSASSLLKLARSAFKLDAQNERLTFEDLALCEGLMCALPSKEISKRYEQRLERARILPAGGLIIQTFMQHLHLNEVSVSSHGVREGTLLAYTRYGQHWLEEVNSIASKRGASLVVGNTKHMQEAQQQPFAEFGREVLPKYANKFLKWPDDVRKQEDIEAVHKMRVASRRLRATLDAFELCADHTSFKNINTRVKKLADALGTVRDTDVMISGLSNTMQEIASEEQAGVQWLIDRLHAYHQQEEQVLDAELRKLDEDAIHQQINNCIPKEQQIMAKAKLLAELDPNVPTGQNARRIAHIRLDEMYGWAANVDKPYEIRGLHNLRIAAKRLRYTLEIFEDVLPPTCQAIANDLAQMQDELGALHDSDVMIALLRLCMGGEDAGIAYELALVHAGKQKSNGKLLLKPSLIATVLHPDVAPLAEQRYGLEHLLRRQLDLREEQYQVFRQHWYQLQARDFRRELLDALSE